MSCIYQGTSSSMMSPSILSSCLGAFKCIYLKNIVGLISIFNNNCMKKVEIKALKLIV